MSNIGEKKLCIIQEGVFVTVGRGGSVTFFFWEYQNERGTCTDVVYTANMGNLIGWMLLFCSF